MDDPAVAPSDVLACDQASVPDIREEWIFPTSFAQRRLWFLDQVQPGSSLYNVPAAFRIRGELDAAILDRAFREVVGRHETLRTTFRNVDGEPMQFVSSHSDFQLAVTDLRHLPTIDRQPEISRVITADSDHPFDLATGPLMRAVLLDFAPDDKALVFTLHHIITDSWSHEVMMREVTAAYSALDKGAAPSLPELPIQYADFASWQRDAMQGDFLTGELDWWRKQLSGFTPLDLPNIPKGAPTRAPEGATFSFEFPEALSASLRTMAQREGVTLFMALLAAWKAYLARYTGQSDITVGSPISNRSRTETEGLIGFFLNTIVLRTSLDGNPTVRDTMLRVRDTALEAFAHQDIPFEMVVEENHPARQAGKNPLLRVMFVLMNGADKSWRTTHATLDPLPIDESKAKFDLMLHLRDTGREIAGSVIYDKSLFTPENIRRIAGQYQALLTSMTTALDARIDSLPLSLPGERERTLRDWNDTDTAFPDSCTIDSLFREQARLRPTAIAIVDGAKTITYGELDVHSDKIAAGLAARGINPGDVVAISLPRSADLLTGILGILKAGATWVPLDGSHPQHRLHTMLKLSGAKLLIGPTPAFHNATTVCPAVALADCEANSKTVAKPADSIRGGADTACIMFTSGSTGVPKGVSVLHRGIARLVINTDYVKFTPDDIVAHASNTSFDASTFEVWGALLNGGRVVIVPSEILISPVDMADFIRDRKLTILFLTTPLFHHMAREIPGAFGTLRYLVAGGDALQPAAARAILDTAPPAHLVNGYGPTEVTTFAVCHEVRDIPADATSIPIGRPISNTRAYILDPAFEPVPPGISGELYLGGPGVAGGYVGNPEATAKAFLPDPFSGDSHASLYKTGDLARWRADGIIEFLGRTDQQVKIRGFRVELGEIESVLLLHPGVKQAVVLARPDSIGQKQLVGYVVPRPGQNPTPAALRQHVLTSLPEYMAPAAFALVDAIPLNPNGKVDSAALPSPVAADSARVSEFPGTWMEAALVDIWGSILDIHPIGVTDDFFELGGHSLLAIRMLAEVEKRTGIKIAPRLLFEGPTIRQLALAARGTEDRSRSAIVPVQTAGDLPPLFFLHGDFVEGGLYCIKMARQIGQDRPFYAIDPHGVHDKAPNSIEEMAADRLQLIREIRPAGPYALGGFCNGGLIAFEMARQLEAMGEKVSTLILLSVDGSNAEFSWLERLISLFPGRRGKFLSFIEWRERILFARAAFKRQLEALATPVPIAHQPKRFARKALRILKKAMRLMVPTPASVVAGLDTTQPESAGVDIGLIYQQACTAYVPRPYDGSAHVLWPSEMALRDPHAGWGSVMPQIQLVKIPGGHFSSLQGANLTVVSEQIRASLESDKA